MEAVEKYHIRKLTVLVSGEKQLFQIKLPRNAKKITGILITVKPFERIKGRPKEPPFPTNPIKTIGTPIREFISLADIKEPLIPIEHAI
jgi:hypothetical protein